LHSVANIKALMQLTMREKREISLMIGSRKSLGSHTVLFTQLCASEGTSVRMDV